MVRSYLSVGILSPNTSRLLSQERGRVCFYDRVWYCTRVWLGSPKTPWGRRANVVGDDALSSSPAAKIRR